MYILHTHCTYIDNISMMYYVTPVTNLEAYKTFPLFQACDCLLALEPPNYTSGYVQTCFSTD